MRKFLTAILLGLALAASFTGCDGCHDHSGHQH